MNNLKIISSLSIYFSNLSIISFKIHLSNFSLLFLTTKNRYYFCCLYTNFVFLNKKFGKNLWRKTRMYASRVVLK